MGIFSNKDTSVIVGDAKLGETAPRRNKGAKDGPVMYPDRNPEMNTIYGILKWACNEYSDLNATASRKLVHTHVKEKMVKKKVDGVMKDVKKQWTFFELSGYTYSTYSKLWEETRNLAAGFIELGIKPKGQEVVHIYASTSREWLTTALALNANAIPVATAYDTLGEEGITHSIVQTDSVAMFTDNALFKTLINPLQKTPNIRILVYKDDIEDPEADEDLEALKKVRSDLKFISYSQLMQLGKKNFVEPITPEPQDLALIMYTSGSTGPPKGVVLTNENVAAGVAGTGTNISHDCISPGAKLLAFLPLAHILEFTFELLTLYWGGTLGYGTIKTLSDTSVINCVGDIREFKPNILIGVPAVWESVRKGILGKIQELNPIVQKIFWGCFYAKSTLAKYGIPLPLVDNLIFKKVRDATGGELLYTFNGGAALSYDTQNFISTLIAPMLIGYGLTETNANCGLMSPRSIAMGTQGEISHAITAKFLDVPEAGYYAKNGQGELVVKGPCVTKEYYKNPKETGEAFTEDGFFRTGDIGEFTNLGHIRLIDRRKNLVKTLNGEYIALEKLESVYRSNPYIHNLCVYADQKQVKPVAIIVPNPGPVQKLAESLGLENHEDIAHDPAVTNAITKSIIETGSKGGLKGIELVVGVVISQDEWTSQNGYLTSAQKLVRKKILNENKKAVDDVYKKNA